MTEPRLSRSERYKRKIRGLRLDLDRSMKEAIGLRGIIDELLPQLNEQQRQHVAFALSLIKRN